MGGNSDIRTDNSESRCVGQRIEANFRREMVQTMYFALIAE